MESRAETREPPQRQLTEPAINPRRATVSKVKEKPTLRYRKTPTFLLIIYLPTLIVPWVLICIMTKRPLGSSSYYDQTGTHYVDNAAGFLVTQLLKAINAVLAVPVISTLLANAAIVYAMRRRPDQKLNVQQLFALADKGWSNYLLLLNANSHGRGSRFLWLAALLVIIAAILQPLISVLVTFEAVAATSCLDIPYKYCSEFGPVTIGFDPEPADMAFLQRDLVLQDVLGRLVTASDTEPQPNLWPVNPDSTDWIDGYTHPPYRRMFTPYSTKFGSNPDGFFVSALENGTNTGVLREHAIRLNSSVHCELISPSDVPYPCPGARPLDIHLDRLGLKLDVCAPGNASQFPFTPSRNRQDITEELYIHLEAPEDLTRLRDNFTVHCTASTTRGYFELGNEQNKYVYGPLLDKWPDPDDIANNFNDFRGTAADDARPTEEDLSSIRDKYNLFLPGEQSIGLPFTDFGTEKSSWTPGPLMVSAEVLFGNYSFLQFLTDNSTSTTPVQAFAAMCEHGSIPFSQILGIIPFDGGPASYCANIANIVNSKTSMGSYDNDITLIAASHARIFNNTEYAEYALMISMYFANRAVLTKTVIAEQPSFGVRPIYYSPGTVMARPTMATASMVVLTILIFLQVVGLAVVTWLIYSVPTWAAAFDAMEVARIGKALKDSDLPPLGPVSRKDEERLTRIDALIGTVTKEGGRDVEEEGEARDGQVEVPLMEKDRVQLALGGEGPITRQTFRKKKAVDMIPT
ncbi:uncharacterized protein F4822DRAFT_45154 [Hypoxylon trugodes]|uniref:uncharacterized protein n=1 Tax=Hypoxylon trugodes TaxID=326681 RepID=UPI0021910C14|nr:uncharacterized protein F4822DRAFT_45154 [Hypoxylon trugodes]KAI1394324.1 hypothetical protein F4822DRAFT_45154 [Hypoxylon trugodes]